MNLCNDDGTRLLVQQAEAALRQGEFDRAIAMFQQLTEAEPAVKSHYWNLGLALLLAGQEAEAQTVWMLAMVVGEPKQIDQWTTELAEVLRSQAEQQSAAAKPETAWMIRQHLREIEPQNLTNWLHLIQTAIAANLLNQDLFSAELLELVRSQPTIDADLLLQTLKQLLASAPLQPGTLKFAEACLQREGDPIEFVFALLDTAISLTHVLGQTAIAIQYVELCLQVYPNNLSILGHLVSFHQNAGEFDRAIAVATDFCNLAVSLADQVFGAFLMLQSLLKMGGFWEDIFAFAAVQEELVQQLAQAPLEPLEPHIVAQLITSTFSQPYIRDSLERNRRTQNQLSEFCQAQVELRQSDRIARYQAGFQTRSLKRDTDKPLRIGYFSHCLKRHSVGWLCRWLFQYHDRSRYEIYGYFWNFQDGLDDALQDWFLAHVTVARKFGRKASEIADQIFADEVDLLIDLDSLTSDISCEVMMLKPAPVQATWLGWDAAGIPAIDYYIADPYVLPTGAEAHYREKLWRLPQTYIAVDGFEVGVPTLRREQLDIPTDAVIYWSGQTALKRHPETVRSQMKIIKAVPNSYFLIKGITRDQSIQSYFLQLATEVGVEHDRLRFLPTVALEAVHRANLAIADVVLDTYPYNGATTTLETLWMGIPLVTRVGEHFSSRNSYGMMINVGVTEGIAHTAAEYVAWGVRFGLEPGLRQQVAWKLHQSRQTAPLWDSRRFTREMEQAYEQMWQIYVDRNR
jgi:predicted O-linked N-acetylglucosamine transferase (SPINDLY family)